MIAPLDCLCARKGCPERAAVLLRMDRATALPLCAACDAQRVRETLSDGDSIISVNPQRVIFSPEEGK